MKTPPVYKSGEVHDLVRHAQVCALELTPKSTKTVCGSSVVNYTEWRDGFGRLYFYCVNNEERFYKTSEEKREYQRLWSGSL
jgi:hypothetical protein